MTNLEEGTMNLPSRNFTDSPLALLGTINSASTITENVGFTLGRKNGINESRDVSQLDPFRTTLEDRYSFPISSIIR